MSFAFDFAGDDISDEDQDVPDIVAHDARQSVHSGKPPVALRSFDLQTLVSSLYFVYLSTRCLIFLFDVFFEQHLTWDSASFTSFANFLQYFAHPWYP